MTGGDNNKSSGYDLGRIVTSQRLAINEATAALKIGKVGEALEALLAAEAPGRTDSTTCQEVHQRRNYIGAVIEIIACTLPAGHFYAQRHEGVSADVARFTWDTAASS